VTSQLASTLCRCRHEYHSAAGSKLRRSGSLAQSRESIRSSSQKSDFRNNFPCRTVHSLRIDDHYFITNMTQLTRANLFPSIILIERTACRAAALANKNRWTKVNALSASIRKSVKSTGLRCQRAPRNANAMKNSVKGRDEKACTKVEISFSFSFRSAVMQTYLSVLSLSGYFRLISGGHL